jgi:hypothetical protein
VAVVVVALLELLEQAGLELVETALDQVIVAGQEKMHHLQIEVLVAVELGIIMLMTELVLVVTDQTELLFLGLRGKHGLFC